MIVEVDIRQVEGLRDRLLKAMTTMYRLIALQLWGDIREESPVATGNLAGSWELNQMSPLTWRIHTAVAYTLSVLEGTDPHEIRPKSAGALAFQIDGKTIFAGVVHHPGTDANPFVDRAITRTESRIDDFVDQALASAGG